MWRLFGTISFEIRWGRGPLFGPAPKIEYRPAVVRSMIRNDSEMTHQHGAVQSSTRAREQRAEIEQRAESRRFSSYLPTYLTTKHAPANICVGSHRLERCLPAGSADQLPFVPTVRRDPFHGVGQ